MARENKEPKVWMGKMEEGNGKGHVREGRKLPLAIPRRIDPRYTVFAKLLA